MAAHSRKPKHLKEGEPETKGKAKSRSPKHMRTWRGRLRTALSR